MVKKTMVKGLLLAFACALTTMSHAQLSGTKNIPGDYPDLATAITTLNTLGVGTGGVTINLLALNAQNAPIGGYVLGSTILNSSTSATKTITINGNNNTVTAYVGTGATDAIFTLQGTDFVTINSLNLAENVLNTTTVSRMEWGYNFVKLNAAAPFDGCQNNTLQNCTVTLNAANPAACGVRMTHTIYGNATILATTGAVVTDANSNNRFYGNHILGTDSAMSLRGMALAGVYDYNNAIGGSTAAQGNFITVGGSTSANVGGVFVAYDSVITFQNNQFDISPAQTNATIGLSMIMTGFGRGNLILRNNYFNIGWVIPAPNVFTGTMYMLRNDNTANTPSIAHFDPTARFVFSGNTMTGADTSVTSGVLYGIYHNRGSFNVDSIYNNTFSNITWSSNARTGAGDMNLIFYNQGARPYTTVQNNVFTNCYKLGANNTSAMICLDNSSNQAGAGLITITNNLVQNCTSNGSMKAFYTGGGIFLNNTQLAFVKYNKVDNVVVNSTSTTTGGALWGVYVANAARGSDVAFDTVTGCRTNAGPLNAIYKNGYADVHNCYVAYDTSATSFVYGIYHLSGYNNSIYNNRISNLTITGAATFNSGIYGINAPGGLGFCNIYNNSITDFNTPQLNSTNALFGIAVATTNYTSKFNIYYNTIKIAANSTGASFGVAGVSIGDKILGVDLRNNIINITSLPKGQGIVTAIQKIPGGNSGPSLLTTSSGNNIYYVPAAGFCFYYADGINIAATSVYGPLNDPNFNNACLSIYKAWMGSKEQTSYSDNNLSPFPGYSGLYAPTSLCFAESNCSPVPGITTDLLGTARPTMADIGALQFNGLIEDVYPPIISYTALPATTVCANVPPTLTTTINDASAINTTTASPRLYYRKASENDAFGTNNTSAFNGWKYVTGTNTSGSTFTFTPNYSLLTSPLIGGDKIIYFVVAQDVANTGNVGANAVAFANGYCLNSVNLPAAAGPTNPAYAKNSYTILTPVTSVLTPPAATLCSGSIMITATGTATAPTNANFGTDTTINLNNDDNTPFNGQQYNHRQQMIIKASELSAQGLTPGVSISSVAFNIAFTFGVTTMDSLNIALGLTSISNFATGTPGGGWAPSTQVYRGSVGLVNGVNTFVLNTPFTWDGTSNLVVDVVGRKNSPLWATGVYNTATVDTMDMYYNDFGTVGAPIPYDSILVHSSVNSVNNVLSNMRPNIILTYGAPKPKHWTPITSLFKNASLTIPMGANDTNSIVYAAPTVTTNYSVVSVLPGCNSAPSNPSVITPMAGFAHILPTGAVTACDSIKLHATSSSNVSYQWQKNGVNIPGATDSVFNATTAGNYRVYVFAGPGCADTATLPANVTIGASPVAIINGNSSGCDSIILTANTGTGLTYQWLNGGTNISGATTNTYIVRSSGSYSVYEQTGLGCKDTSDVVVDTVNASPSPQIAHNGMVLSTTILYPTYQWNKNGVPIPGATNSTYLVTRDGSYTVTVTTTSGCSGTSMDIQLVGNAVTTVATKNTVSIYPNPTRDVVYVRSSTNVNIVVRDLVGKVIKQQANTKEISLGEIADGIYLITLTDASGNVLLNEKLFK